MQIKERPLPLGLSYFRREDSSARAHPAPHWRGCSCGSLHVEKSLRCCASTTRWQVALWRPGGSHPAAEPPAGGKPHWCCRSRVLEKHRWRKPDLGKTRCVTEARRKVHMGSSKMKAFLQCPHGTLHQQNLTPQPANRARLHYHTAGTEVWTGGWEAISSSLMHYSFFVPAVSHLRVP